MSTARAHPGSPHLSDPHCPWTAVAIFDFRLNLFSILLKCFLCFVKPPCHRRFFCSIEYLISGFGDAASAFFKVDKEIHEVEKTRKELIEEIERGTAQKILRCQLLTD